MNKTIIGSIILSCSLLSGCGGGGGNNSKTHTTTTESTSVTSITTSGTAGSEENNTVSAPAVGTEATEATEATGVIVKSEPELSTQESSKHPVSEKPRSELQYTEGTVLTRTIDDVDSGLLYKSNVQNNNDAYILSMKDNEIIVDIVPLNTGDPADYRKLAARNLNIIRDKEGKAVGFYGLVETYTWETARNLSGKARYGRMDYVVATNGEDKRLPSVAGNYNGKVFYDHNQAPGKEADISLRYEDNKVTGTITGRDNPEFSLKIDTREYHEVEKDGSFLAALVGNKKPNDKEMHGYIDGGFYGKDGEIVAGYVRSRDDDSWGGVFGGERQE
ncbi:transferrin-binding protein-like solute binding protein [Salmonella enterica]|nr:transferrin-binding protein-like solute binding protein [Salmonella enterica]EHO9076679.1 transferrin-binding protein-like solute binding protein [Salmonella enterica]EHZ2289711.1 transferrin-binding protein-like solute binding protein [Salmonella enterica]EIL0751480.1 transferrin-binding protein-like solute binding protein [Salmonella enterica]EKQ2080739.1 transferrin-binding protein-like solute binding protein [Salmonella enterica]